jgi:uracil-DNA glycosylase family 4
LNLNGQQKSRMSFLSTAEKKAEYDALVQARRLCRACVELVNPSVCQGGAFDSDAIGAWSNWQGNLDALVMVIGQDWGDVAWFLREKGRSTDTSRTNSTLLKLLASIGFEIKLPSETTDGGVLFFTNAILCLKKDGAQAAVRANWFRNCGTRFLRPVIELVQPKVVICLGQRAHRAVLSAFDLKVGNFNDAVLSKEPTLLPINSRVFAVYHCGAGTLNRNRNFEHQLQDWHRIGEFLSRDKAGSILL